MSEAEVKIRFVKEIGSLGEASCTVRPVYCPPEIKYLLKQIAERSAVEN